jgi:hypothetical protein
MTAPHFNILTQEELTIDLSRDAMRIIEAAIVNGLDVMRTQPDHVYCEIDNFRNTLLNLLERSEPKPGNMDLIGG